MTPLAAVALAAANGYLPKDRAAPDALRSDAAAGGTLMLALAELAGDKMKSAPDRIVPLGLAARAIMVGFAAGAVAPRGRFAQGAAIGAATAVAASFPGWRARIAAMERHGQTDSGMVEDAMVIAGAAAIMAGVARAH